MVTELPDWAKVWREAIAPEFTDSQLRLLRGALTNDDPRLIQKQTTRPLPMLMTDDGASPTCEAGCAISFPMAAESGWTASVCDVEDYFMDFSELVCNHYSPEERHYQLSRFLTWFDDSPRETMRTELLAEVNRELERRGG